MKPIFTSSVGIYSFEWSDKKIKVTVSRLIETSKQSLSAEIVIQSIEPERHLHQARLTLTDTRQRKSLENTLNGRTEGVEKYKDIDWYEIIEYVCVKTLEKYREGTPPIQLGDLPEATEIEYQLCPVLIKGEPTLIYGDGGIGKTNMALFWALLVQHNHPYFNLEPQQTNCLYLDWEASERVLKRRVDAMKKGLGITDKKTILYRYCTQPLPSDALEIQSIILKNDIGLVVIDPVALACGADPETAETAIRFFNALRSLNITTLSVHHIAKISDGKKPFGSVFWHNSARSSFEIRNSQRPEDNEIHLGIYHRKMNDAPLLKPMGYTLQFFNEESRLNQITFATADLSEIPELEKGLPLRERLTNALGAGSKTPEELAEELEDNQSSIARVLYRYKDKNFVKLGKEWGLKAYDSDTL